MNVDSLPDVEFCATDAEEIEKNIIAVYKGLTGKTLFEGDPVRLFLEGLAAVIIQQRHLINYTGKQNLLKWAAGPILDHMGGRVNTPRLEATPALTTIRFFIGSTLAFPVPILKGKRVSPDGKLFFESTEYAEIISGALFVDVPVKCQTAGVIGNGLLPGQVAKMVDPLDHITEISNTITTAGGADIEDDDSYRDRIQLAPESFSVAGPTGAYIHWAKSAHQDIKDVAVYRNSGLDALDRAALDTILGVFGVDPAGMTDAQARIAVGDNVTASLVNVCPLLKDGGIPDQSILDLVAAMVNNRTKRPLTDQVAVAAPGVVNYDINLTYYILEADQVAVADIQASVAAAVDTFTAWQKESLGRDVNPDKLTSLLYKAGAYKTIRISPAFTQVEKNQVALLNAMSVNYGGLVSE